MSNAVNEIKKGNYSATVTTIQDGYGDIAFRLVFGYHSTCNSDGGNFIAYKIQNYSTEPAALRSAKRELAKCA